MERKPFGSTGGHAAVIGQGTWQLRDPAAAVGALRGGLALGTTRLDTAELYRGSEEATARPCGGVTYACALRPRSSGLATARAGPIGE